MRSDREPGGAYAFPDDSQYAGSGMRLRYGIPALSGGKGGASLAAAFLEEFIEDGIEWIHLDIAGSADTDNGEGYRTKGATGAMVETMAALFEK